jgi:uncharacterized RmlC-like cupin family protein
MRVVKPGPDHGTARGVVGGSEVSEETVGAVGLFMGVFRVPPGGRSRPHFHEGCESACYMLTGRMRVRWGDRLQDELVLEPHDLLYVPPRETHVLENLSDTEPAEYVVARNAPHEDSVEVPWVSG